MYQIFYHPIVFDLVVEPTNRLHNLHSGSPVLSRINTYYPDRFDKYVFLDIGYMAPGQLLSGQVVLSDQNRLGYQTFFNTDGSGALVDQHVSSPH